MWSAFFIILVETSVDHSLNSFQNQLSYPAVCGDMEGQHSKFSVSMAIFSKQIFF